VAGEPPLSGIIPRYPRPNPILVERPDGRRLTATAGTNKELQQYPDQRPVLDRLRRLALTGQAAVLRPTGTLKGDAIVFAAAPVRGANGRIVAVVLLQANDIQVTPGRFFQGAVALFGVATVVLVLIASVPLLALSFVFSYFLARGFTRRLEAVSRVATAIAAGNLSERAPVSTRNEVGLLAGDINRMAAHLETTIAELEQARTQAEEALRLRQQLVANVSHELRTPLAVVRAHLDALAMRKPAVGAHRASLQAATGAPLQDAALTVPAAALDAVAAEIGRLESLVEDLFALSRAESDALDVRCEAVDVARIVGEVAGQMRPLVQREGGITLTVEAPPGLPQAQADPERLRQILGNLVRNAVRHTPEGGIIALTVSSENEWIVAGVADTGEGIAPEHLPHIFERFYRADDARSRERGGAGLGLAIVRELVELMGGRVTVESVPGEGTCFRVYLRRGPNLAAQQ
jgi:signal transduction histidine kinase